ncbi:MAG: nucleoside-diphosphate kinase [Firmicutes bacterium]|nr:nucleoside-diphosphate kinase [Bacillota bacterium]
MDRTYVMVKPDGVQRNLVGEIVSRFEKRGIKIVALKMMRIPKALAEKHYGEHQSKPFFGPLVEFITSGPVVAMVLEAKDVVSTVRDMMGATDPLKAAAGTIRGSFGLDVGRNVVHGSDSNESAAREIALFFTPGEINDYNKEADAWLYE